MNLAHLQYFGLGVIGGVLVDGMAFVNVVKAGHGRPPVRYRRPWTWVAEGLRLLVGGTLAAVFYASRQVDTPLAAVTVGIAAPIIIDRLARPLAGSSSEDA